MVLYTFKEHYNMNWVVNMIMYLINFQSLNKVIYKGCICPHNKCPWILIYINDKGTGIIIVKLCKTNHKYNKRDAVLIISALFQCPLPYI